MNKKKIITLASVLVLLIVGMVILSKIFMPKATEGDKAVTIVVVHGDGSSKNFNYNTDEEYLGELITSKKLAEGEVGQYGLFIKTVDGETADESKEQWWCITAKGEMVMTAADQTPLNDGDTFELTLRTGY